jgi:hypothetical protein
MAQFEEQDNYRKYQSNAISANNRPLSSAIPFISQRVVAKTIIENMVVEISVVDRVRQVRTAWGK